MKIKTLVSRNVTQVKFGGFNDKKRSKNIVYFGFNKTTLQKVKNKFWGVPIQKKPNQKTLPTPLLQALISRISFLSSPDRLLLPPQHYPGHNLGAIRQDEEAGAGADGQGASPQHLEQLARRHAQRRPGRLLGGDPENGGPRRHAPGAPVLQAQKDAKASE